MVKNGWLQIRCGEEQLKTLDLLADAEEMSRSFILRQLIPPRDIAEALVEASIRSKETGQLAPSFAMYYANQLIQEMDNDYQNPIRLQREIICSGLNPFAKAAQLYITWSRAKRAVSGYRFEQILYQGKSRFTIAIGPGDTEENVEALKKRIVEYAERLGL
jgi:hypothetical protein